MHLISTILPLAAITTAMVFLDQQVMQQIAFEKQPQSYLERIKASVEEIWSGIEESSENFAASGGNALDNAFNAALDAGKKAAARFECYHSMTAFDAQGWLDSAFESVEVDDIHDTFDDPHKKPKHPKYPPLGHDPRHKSNQTVYQLIAGSKYTTRLAQLVNRYPDLVELLNGTTANYTVFAPIDKAFDKIPEHVKEPSKEAIYQILTYHVSPIQYDAFSVFFARTIRTILTEDALGGYEQRLRVGFGLGGLHLNFYSKIVAANIFGTNGVIHGIDTLILPPPPASKIIELVPSEFSTLELALVKTGLDKVLAEPHTGGTLFAPSNAAFVRLGPKVNAFLFSKYGKKYLKALIEYHIVVNKTMYSDAYFYGDKDSDAENTDEFDGGGPKGTFHVDLPTLLHKRSLSIDITRWGRLITIKINGFTTVAVPDGIAKDGVIHVLSNVLTPPKIPGAAEWTGVEMSVDEFKDRFDDYLGKLEL